MKNNNYYKIGNILYCFGISFLMGIAFLPSTYAQTSKQAKTSPTQSTASTTPSSFSTDSKEDISKRTRISKNFINADGTRTAQIGGNYHYKDANGQWQDIDLNIAVNADGSFSNVKNNVKVQFPRTAGAGMVNFLTEEGQQFNFWRDNKIAFVNNGSNLVTWQPANVTGTVSGQSLNYNNIYPSINEQFVTMADGVENNLILQSLSSQISSLPQTATMSVSHFIPLQNGWVVRDGNGTIKNGNFESTTFSIQIGAIENQIFFGQTVLFDAATTKESAMLIHSPAEKLSAQDLNMINNHVLAINHSIRFVNGGIEVTDHIPAAWLKNPNRQYPVVVDPTVTVTPPSPSSNFYGPLTNWWGFQRHASLYLQSEIGSLGTITKLEYNRTTTTGVVSNVPVTIQLKSTIATTLASGATWNSTTYTSGIPIAYNEIFNVGATDGWKSFTLTTPFQYDNGNLLVMVKDVFGGSGSSKNYNQSASIAGRQTYNRNDVSDPGEAVVMTTEDSRLTEIRITYTELTPCTGVPLEATVVSTHNEICANTPFTLSLPNITLTSGNTVQWQTSTDGTTWTNVGAPSLGTSYIVTTGITEETQYRAIITCENSTDQTIATATTITINPPLECYCEPEFTPNCTDGDLILNVTFESINNPTDCSTNGYQNFSSSTPHPDVNAGQSYPIAVQVGNGWNYESVGVWLDYNQNGVLDSLEGEYIPLGTGSGNTITGNIPIAPNAVGGPTRMRVGLMASIYPLNHFNCGPLTAIENFGEIEDYTVNIIPLPIESITVTTVDDVPAVIDTYQGTLQVESTLLPAWYDQSVTWSITTATGNASIDQTGTITAIADGIVYAKAVSVVDNNFMDSLLITISNQIPRIDSVVVGTIGNIIAAIDVPRGTLAHLATVYPLHANQAVTWSIVHDTGTGTIDAAGIVTAGISGYVWAKATSIQDPTKMDSIRIVITNHDLALQTINTANITIAPNPTADVINIQSSDKHNTLTLFITDATGKVVLEENINAGKLYEGHLVNMTKYKAGVYILQLKGSDIDYMQRIIRK